MSVYTWSEIVLAGAFCALVALVTVICIRCHRNPRTRVEAKSSDTEKASVRSSAHSGEEWQHDKEEAKVINELPVASDRTEIHGNKETTDITTNDKDNVVNPLINETNASVHVSKWTDSVISDGTELLPPVCGSVDQFRKSYAYICTNPRVRSSSTAAEAGTGSDSLKSDVFFDAASSNSGELGTLAKWILDLKKMSDGGTRGSNEIAKSYDTSSEDSFTTAVESSEETDEVWGLKPVSEKPSRKRRVSRKARSFHLANSHNMNMRDKTKKNATWGPGKPIQEGAPCSSSSTGYKSGSSRDHEAEALCETEHEPFTVCDPIYTNFSGIISEALRQDAYANYLEETESESLQQREDTSNPFGSNLVLRDGIFVRSGSVSSIGVPQSPRSGPCEDVMMWAPGLDGARRKPPLKPARHSLSLQETQTPNRLPVHPRSCHIPPPKPCSHDVTYVNFRGSLRR